MVVSTIEGGINSSASESFVKKKENFTDIFKTRILFKRITITALAWLNIFLFKINDNI